MIDFELAKVEAELHVLFPSLHISSPLIILGSGFNSIVVEANETIVFRIGKTPIAREGYEKEASCLSIIAHHLPFLIPLPKWYNKSSAYFPFGIIGYDKIPGLPLHPNVLNKTNLGLLVNDTATFLLALHNIPPQILPLKNAVDRVSKWEKQYQTVLPVLKDELTPKELKLIKQWWNHFLADKNMQAYDPVIQHGDLWYENMLVDSGMEKLIGIVDWERLSIGDPLQDFATLFHLGETFVRQVIQAYQSIGGELDENFEYRMQRLWEAREFDGLEYAIKFDDPIELNDTFQKLRRGPILKKRGETNV